MTYKGISECRAITLTAGIDNVTGTSGNDTVLGLYNVNGTTSTFGSADVINGGAGTDTLSVVVENASAGVTFPSATISNIENVDVRNVSGQALTIDTSVLGSSLAVVAADRSTATTTLTNLASGVAVTVKGDGSAVNEEVLAQFKTASGATALTLNLSGGTNQTTTGKAINVDTTNATGLATVNINSTGAANKFGGIDLNATALAGTDGTATVTTVNIAAATNLDVSTDGITGLKAASANTINVSGAATSVKLGALENTVTTLNASGLTDGGVSATIGTSTTQKVTGGAGADTITSAGILLDGVGFVDAGAGTDTLVLTTAIGTTTAQKASAALYKNFEVIQVSDSVSQDVSIFSGITGVVINDSTSNTGVTNLSAAQAANVTVLAAHSTGAVTIGVKDATTPGQIDTVKILAKPVATAPNTAIDLTGLAMTGVEKLELTASTGTATTTLTMTGSTDLDSVKLFGASPVDVATGNIAQKINLAIDASGVTAQATGTTTATLSAAAATGTNGIALTGSAGDDIIRDSSGGNDVIVGGAGNDQIFFTGGTDIITGGAGADIINAGSTTSSASSANTFTLKFAAGDSVSKAGAANGYDATVTDSVIAIDNSGVFSSNSGNKFTIDTADSAAAVTFGTAAITLGTTTVTNAYDFHVYYDAAASAAYVYQDTDGDKVLEAGEFSVKLVGTAADFATGEFTVASGNLVFTSA